MYYTALKCGYRCVARFCGGLSQPSLAGCRTNNLKLHLGQLRAPLHTCSPRQRLWQRPLSSLLTHTTTCHPQQGPVLSRVAGLSSFTSASELSAAIAAAPTAAALQGLAAAAASTPHQAWLVQQYKVQLLPGLAEVSPSSLVKALLFFSQLGPGHAELFERAVPVLYNRLGALTPAELLDLLAAYAAAAQHSPSTYSQELFAALTEFLWEGLEDLEAAGLADIAASYAAVDHYDDDEDFFGGVAAAALHKLESFCPEDLSRLLAGLSRLRFTAPDLTSAALAQLVKQLDAWPLSAIGHTLAALAALQAPADPCSLEKVAAHVSSALRNMRTSTDGKQLLAGLMQLGTSSGSNAPTAAAAAPAAAAVGGTLPGLAGTTGNSTRLGPSWQGFGSTRTSSSSGGHSSSSSSSSSSGSSGSSSDSSSLGSGSSNNGSTDSSSSARDGAASIFAAASSSSRYQYGDEDAVAAGAAESARPPPPGVTHVLQQECELGPDYITVTSYGTDGRVTTTYIKKAAAGSSLGLDAISRSIASSSSGDVGSAAAHGSSSSSSGGGAGGATSGITDTPSSSSSSSSNGSNSGVKAPPGTRAMSNSNRGWRPYHSTANGVGGSSSGGGDDTTTSSSTSSRRGGLSSRDDGCPASWEWQSVSRDCRPVYDDAAALQGALVDLVWSYAMLGHVHSGLVKECWRALGLVSPDGLSDAQLGMLWSCHMRYQQLGHVMLDPNPLLAESYSVFAREVSRAAPRTLALPPSLQPQAAGQWLLASIRASPEYQQQQQHGQQQAQHASFRSWKYRDPSVLTQAGLESSVRQALVSLGLPVGSPCVTLDGLERVGLPLKHNGVCIAWQVLPPAVCSRNPPHSPTVDAQAVRWALQYRGYTVLQVPFNEWASVLDSGDSLVAAGYLQHLLDSITTVRAPHVPNF